jgi:two-component system sensor histidine kinase/response regulator
MEDDRGLARLTQASLKPEGMTFDIAENGKAGLEMLHQKAYDVIMVDYRMPGMTGLEVLEAMMQQEDIPPVIMVTGGGSEKTAVEAMKLGASDYIVKDIDAGYLELVPLIVRQVIQRHRLIQEKREAEEAREQLIQELDAFAHTVAHDLKTPLYSVQINMDRLREIRDMPAREASRLVDGMEDLLNKMSSIIEELFVLSSVRKEEVDFQILDMREIVDEALQRLGFLIHQYQPEIHIPDTLPDALGHAPWVEEVWSNYLSNAIKYGGTPPRLEIGATRLPGEYVQYWIKDNGKGVPLAQQPKLFIPFTRLDTLKAEGHGLGLSIVQRIVQKLDGHCGFENLPEGRGACFHFSLLKA